MEARIRDIDALREEIRSSTTIEEVSASYGLELHRSGADHMKGLCPFHQEEEPSFSVSKSRQLWHCFGCKEGGDVFSLIQRFENVGFVDAMMKLATIAGVDVEKHLRDPTPEEKYRDSLRARNLEVMNTTVASAKRSKKWKEWVDGRRLDVDVLAEYGVGYSASPPGGQWASELALDWEAKWGGAIVIPLMDTRGRVQGFRTRPLSGWAKSVGPKSNHPLEIPSLYGLYQARGSIRESGGSLILVEGEVDVWQMAAHGYRNVAALLGSVLRSEQIEELAGIGVARVVLMPDGDDAGMELARRVSTLRLPKKPPLLVAALDGGDPDELLLSDPDMVSAAIDGATHRLEFLVRSVVVQAAPATLTEKLAVLEDLAEPLAEISSAERDLAAGLLSDMLGMEKEAVRDYYADETSASGKLYSSKAERVVLAAAMRGDDFTADAVVRLRSNDFYIDKHARFFSAIQRLFISRDMVDPGIIKEFLDSRGDPASGLVGGLLKEGVEAAPYFLDVVRDKSVRRGLKAACDNAIRRVDDADTDGISLVQDMVTELSRSATGSRSDVLVDASDVVSARMREIHERVKDPQLIVGLDLGPGWPILNHTIHGLQRRRYCVFAAPSGTGKTALACTFASRISVDLGEPALYLTFETDAETLIDRIVGGVSGVELDRTLTGFLTADELDVLQSAAARVAASPLVVTEGGASLEEAIALIRQDHLRRGTRVVFLDYVQLMYVRDRKSRMARHDELGTISRELRALTRELDITTVAIAQINREGAKRGISSKEDTGGAYQIAQDSDLFYVLREKTRDEIETDGIDRGNLFGFIDKHRHGRQKVGVSIRADLDVMRMGEVQ